MGIAQVGQGVARETIVHHLGFLEADDIRVMLFGEGGDVVEAKPN
jgi:hypothetical protein